MGARITETSLLKKTIITDEPNTFAKVTLEIEGFSKVTEKELREALEDAYQKMKKIIEKENGPLA